MALVATLISNPKAANLSQSVANMAGNALGATTIEWLAPEIACDIAVPEGLSREAAEQAIRAALGDAPIDVAVQEADGRRKKMLIADMDSTMIDQECIDELAAEVGIKDHVAAITARAMNGEIAFEPALRERVALLKGLELSVIDRVIEGRITLASGGRELIATMRANGAYAALVSGGFTVFTGRIAEMLGFHEHRSNTLIEEDGKLAGLVAEPILGREAKANSLNEIADRLGITPAEVMAVGDGANDLDMLRIAGAGVALHAKPSVAAQAQIRIDHGDLTALLYLQGYRQEEFAG
ncbi:phosphoserine phosphatase SerB [Nitratireductor aestuarii]|uniref:Phosphoserine phosphatase n=1 Tax=Nitratireductor aestuarii TaxID=1735103 RepID=A0A916WAP2_9HYPH|nr:phosphoserine phosphatase SerB [Nitratireductor aestuarii]GGA80655.1 phosphoserine phosphatase SerB [Nitratireductor aestuarii]